jgi:hypothetical protein
VDLIVDFLSGSPYFFLVFFMSSLHVQAFSNHSQLPSKSNAVNAITIGRIISHLRFLLVFPLLDRHRSLFAFADNIPKAPVSSKRMSGAAVGRMAARRPIPRCQRQQDGGRSVHWRGEEKPLRIQADGGGWWVVIGRQAASTALSAAAGQGGMYVRHVWVRRRQRRVALGHFFSSSTISYSASTALARLVSSASRPDPSGPCL